MVACEITKTGLEVHSYGIYPKAVKDLSLSEWRYEQWPFMQQETISITHDICALLEQVPKLNQC